MLPLLALRAIHFTNTMRMRQECGWMGPDMPLHPALFHSSRGQPSLGQRAMDANYSHTGVWAALTAAGFMLNQSWKSIAFLFFVLENKCLCTLKPHLDVTYLSS